MAWNPSPEVAAARDAAKALGNAPICVVLWLDEKTQRLGMASYGRTMPLCKHAGDFGNHLLKAALKWGEDDFQTDGVAT